MSLRRYRLNVPSIALLSGAIVTSASGIARADVSTWISVTTGVSQVHSFDIEKQLTPTLRFGTGMGTDPSHPWVVGGMFRIDTLFGKGTDLSLLARLANQGFVNGDWGFAFDLGPTARFWGADTYGAAAIATLGMPWGLELGLNGNLGAEHVRSYGCFLGIDLARLTVYRRTGSTWWKNPFPAYRTPDEDAH